MGLLLAQTVSFDRWKHVLRGCPAASNNPKTAVHEWLKTHPELEIDKDIDNMLLISVAPDGYLKRVGWFQSGS